MLCSKLTFCISGDCGCVAITHVKTPHSYYMFVSINVSESILCNLIDLKHLSTDTLLPYCTSMKT